MTHAVYHDEFACAGCHTIIVFLIDFALVVLIYLLCHSLLTFMIVISTVDYGLAVYVCRLHLVPEPIVERKEKMYI